MGYVRLIGEAQKRCPLVFVEWEDSAQPVSNWSYLADIEEASAVVCASVGWLARTIHERAVWSRRPLDSQGIF